MIRKLLTIAFFVSATLSMTAQVSTKPAIPRDAALEAKIEKTLKGGFCAHLCRHG